MGGNSSPFHNNDHKTISNSKSQKGGDKRRRSTLKGIDAANLLI
jgi:hypothetical protein